MRRKPHARYVGHGAPVVGLDFHPQNQLLASASYDMTTRLWDVNTGREMLRVAGLATHFSRDGQWLMHQTGRWRMQSPAGIGILHVPVAERRDLRRITDVAIHPGGRWMVLTNGTQLTVWDRAEHRILHQEALAAEFAEFSQNGDFLCVGGSRLGVWRWRVNEETEGDHKVIHVRTPEVIRRSSISEWSSNKRRRPIAVGTIDNTMAMVDVGAGAMLSAPVDVSRGYSGAVSGDGKWLAAGAWGTGKVTLVDITSGETVHTISSSAAEVRFSADGRLLAIGESERFRLFEVESWREVFSTGDRTQGELPGPVAFCPGGRFVAHLAGNRVTVCVRDAKTFDELATLRLPDGQITLKLAFSPDSHHLFVATSAENQLYDIDLRTLGKELSLLQIDEEGLQLADVAEPTTFTDLRYRVALEKPPELRDWTTTIAQGVEKIGRQFTNSRQPPVGNRRPATWQGELDRYNEKLKQEPGNGDHWWRRGNFYRGLGRIDDALADFQRAIEIQPSSHHAYYWRGLTYMEAYRYEEAVQDFERSLQIHPADHWPCRHLAWMYVTGPAELRDLDRGMQLALRAVELNGNHVTHHETLAWAFVRMGDTVSALRELDAAAKIAPPSTSAELVRAICAYRVGQRERAEKHWESAIGQLDASRTLPREALQDLCDEVASLLKP
jgi:tetratricopeptide (TPR) repeat protein